MDGRLALSRRQDGRAADGMLPLTERLLAWLPGPRVAWVLAWAAVPVAAGLLPGAYLATVGAKPLSVRLLAGGGVRLCGGPGHLGGEQVHQGKQPGRTLGGPAGGGPRASCQAGVSRHGQHPGAAGAYPGVFGGDHLAHGGAGRPLGGPALVAGLGAGQPPDDDRGLGVPDPAVGPESAGPANPVADRLPRGS